MKKTNKNVLTVPALAIRKAFAAIALIGVLGITPAYLTGCQNSTDTPSETEQGGEYDKDGYDKEGYDKAGYDKDGYNREGYDKNGYDKNGNKKDDDGKGGDNPGGNEQGGDNPGGNEQGGGSITIPTSTINVNINPNNENLTNGDGIEGNAISTIRYNVIPPILNDFVVQGGTLRSSYTTVKGAYPNIPGIQNIINAETSIANINNWSGIANGAPTQYADAIVNAIFTNDASTKTAFNKELTAYQKGAYFEQKQRFNGDKKFDGLNDVISSDPSRATLIGELQSALTTAGVNTPLTFGTDSSGNTTITNLQVIMNELKPSMLAKINTAMGVDQMSGTNKTQVQTLNSNLLTQIGEDFFQIKAFVDDINDMNSSIISWEYIIDGYTQYGYPQTAMGTQGRRAPFRRLAIFHC
jgi:hypothetical protein